MQISPAIEESGREIVFQGRVPAVIRLCFLTLIYEEHRIDKSRTADYQSAADKTCKAATLLCSSDNRLCICIYVSVRGETSEDGGGRRGE